MSFPEDEVLPQKTRSADIFMTADIFQQNPDDTITLIQVGDSGNFVHANSETLGCLTEDGGDNVFTEPDEFTLEDDVVFATTDGSLLGPSTVFSTSQPVQSEEDHSSMDSLQESVHPSFLIQSHDTYKLDLLGDMAHVRACESFADLSVFCCDGVTWVSKLLLAASSPLLRKAFTDLETGQADLTCLILPDIKKNEFLAFHESLFTSVKTSKVDLLSVFRVADILGVDLMKRPSSPEPFSASKQTRSFFGIDYRSIRGNNYDWRRVMRSVGYDTVDVPSSALADSGGMFDKTKSDVVRSIAQLSLILDSNFECDWCRRNFVDQSSLKQHVKLLHEAETFVSPDRYRDYVCDQCDKTFMFLVSLKNHKWLKHRKGRPPVNKTFDAAIHKKSTINLDKLDERVKNMKEKMEDMACPICGFTGTSWKSIEIHIMDHTNERPFKCKTCGKGFKEAQKLERHLVVHTGEKNFTCKYCGKAFGLRHNMKSHEKVHEGGGAQCEYCGKIFSQSSALRLHEHSHKKKKHVRTHDPELRRVQTTKGRGRPSLVEEFRKKQQMESVEDCETPM